MWLQEIKYRRRRVCAYLQCGGTRGNDVAGLFQGMGSSHFSFRRNHFGPRLSPCFRLRGHGSLELYRKSDVLSEAEASVWYPFQAVAEKFMDEHASVIMNGVKTVMTTFTINIMTETSLLLLRALKHFQKCASIFSISFSLQLI